MWGGETIFSREKRVSPPHKSSPLFGNRAIKKYLPVSCTLDKYTVFLEKGFPFSHKAFSFAQSCGGQDGRQLSCQYSGAGVSALFSRKEVFPFSKERSTLIRNSVIVFPQRGCILFLLCNFSKKRLDNVVKKIILSKYVTNINESGLPGKSGISLPLFCFFENRLLNRGIVSTNRNCKEEEETWQTNC